MLGPLMIAAAVASAVPTITLNNGVVMPLQALGTGGWDDATASQAVQTAFSVGLAHFHTGKLTSHSAQC
jgi:diketogulonate reductase-like aldo/keto reductase